MAPNIRIRLCAYRVHMRYSIGHTFSMLTGHCVVLRLHAFSRSRDRSLKPRSTTMLVSTRAFKSEWAKNTRGWRVVSIPREDARRTDIVACIPVFASMTTMRWSHSASTWIKGCSCTCSDSQSAERDGFSGRFTQRLHRGSVFVYVILTINCCVGDTLMQWAWQKIKNKRAPRMYFKIKKPEKQ